MIASKVCDRDFRMKAKAEVYADKKRNATDSHLSTGDQVVYTKTGNSVVIESPDAVQLKRNNTHVKKYEQEIAGQDEKTPLPFYTVPTESASEQETAKCRVFLSYQKSFKIPL